MEPGDVHAASFPRPGYLFLHVCVSLLITDGLGKDQGDCNRLQNRSFEIISENQESGPICCRLKAKRL